MRERTYDPALPYRYAEYGRMSNKTQNKRSPDQQFATNGETITRLRYPWQHVVSYRDNAISGQYVKKRPGLQTMLRDIEAGLIAIDLIVVDTYERLGRAQEISQLRHKLLSEYGVMVVAADNNFADPTGVVGKAIGMVEQIRATENTRISRHNVIRGKKDAARQGRWPGGPPPFGFKLKVVIDQSGPEPDVYNVLEFDPGPSVAQQLAYARAYATGEGLSRLSKWWNENPEIPEEYKPISPSTMGYRLANPIYVGTLVWGAMTTGIVNETRVVERNDEAEVIRIPNFCPPLVSPEVFQAIDALRRTRGDHLKAARRRSDPADGLKLIAPQSRGLTLKYLLSGLVRCGSCNASMRALPSGRTSKAGKRYVYYVCPRHYESACDNGWLVPEDRLREAVVARLRAQLFPAPEPAGQVPGWLPKLMTLVQQELGRLRQNEPDRSAAAAQELQDLGRQLSGWAMSLGDPHLPASVRSDLAVNYEKAKHRQGELAQALAGARALEQYVERTLDAATVIAQLRRLGGALDGSNPTLGNLEVSRHVDRIDCYPDGRVQLRGTQLGLFDGAVELLSRHQAAPLATAATTTSSYAPVVPRQRGRLQVPSLSATGQAETGDPATSLDPERFAGLADLFFWDDEFLLETQPCWAEEHAEAVYAAKQETGLTFTKLAPQFGKSRPTIQKAWKIAADRRRSDPAGLEDPASSDREAS